MARKLNSEINAFLDRLKTEYKKGQLPEKYYYIFLSFFESFHAALENGDTNAIKQFNTFLDLSLRNLQSPYQFPLYHQKIRTPFDYYRFSVDFFRPIVDFANSKVLGEENIIAIEKLLKNGQNVVLFANHQTEPDPQFISLLLEKKHPDLADKIIFVAGEKVTTDTLAIPFSMGTDLLCIYSKKYIDNPPENQLQKQLHNKKTMKKMQELLIEGSKIIYVAPSGGRDRADKNGLIIPSLFDPKSIEMFYLMAQRAKTHTHFYPLALATYHLFPPPETTKKEIGEERHTKKSPISLSLGNEIDMKSFDTILDKEEKRSKRANFIYNKMLAEYHKIS